MRRAQRGLVVVMMLAVIGATPARAQDRPVVFLHGLRSAPAEWEGAAGRLGQRLQIAPTRPTLSWSETYARQADLLASQINPPAQTTVAVGHSNGGIVAREWSRRRPLSGIVTVGTPHAGAPLVTRFNEWAAYATATTAYGVLVSKAFNRPSNTSWVFNNVAPLVSWAISYGTAAVVDLGATLGIDARFPVIGDMRPGSSYLTGLNAAGNINREASAVPRRVGSVSVAHNYYWAGPMRALVPEAADAIATTLYGTIAGLDFWAGWILANSPHGDPQAIQQAQSLFSIAGHLASIDEVYCAMVSSPSLNQCVPNDGVVPHTSQRYPNALNIVLGTDGTWGPAHTRMTRESDDALYQALAEVMQIPARGASPPPTPVPPPSGPSVPPGGGSSGPGYPDSRSVMRPGDRLRPGEAIRSDDGRFTLSYQGDGNLVLYQQGTPLWASGTNGRAPGSVVMQHDGNFVMYDANDLPIWASGSSLGYPGAWLTVQSDGNVVIYSAQGVPLWATNTVR